MGQIVYPLVNGRRPSFAEVSFTIGGVNQSQPLRGEDEADRDADDAELQRAFGELRPAARPEQPQERPSE